VYGIDWGNTDPLAMVKLGIDQRQKLVYVSELNYESGMNLTEINDLLKRTCTKHELIVCDHNEGTTRDTLSSYGWNIRNAIKKPINDRIRAIQDYTIVVCGNSTNLVKELNNSVWHDKKSEIRADGNDHLINAMEYSFTELTSRPTGLRQTIKPRPFKGRTNVRNT
jgi:phage terminase large subunit